MKFSCCDERRLEVLRRLGSQNAIEYLEVLDHAAPANVPRQRTLLVRLLRGGFVLTRENIRIDGGERIREVLVEWAAAGDALPPEAEPGLLQGVDDPARLLVVRTDSAGDFSRYNFALVADSGTNAPPAGFDPRLSTVSFSFKVECPSDFDCAAAVLCPPDTTAAPPVDYLAKDYQGFRRLMLDRMSLLAPDWQERSVADVGVATVELLAYVADTLSYRQDAIANEAYLGTARRRVSVRRHARLVDYRLHEGCNSRAFVHFMVSDGAAAQHLPRRSRLLTRGSLVDTLITPDSDDERRLLSEGALTFETVHAATLHFEHNQLLFYTWGDVACCLPRGATRATLRGHVTDLEAGHFLVFVEVTSPTTFVPADADSAHRHAVRLRRVVLDEDPSGQLFNDPPVDGPLPITHIEWDTSDALPFALCISSLAQPDQPVSVALGNIVLVEHGATEREETLPIVPAVSLSYAVSDKQVGDCCRSDALKRPPLRYRPRLARTPVTHGFDLEALLAVPLEGERGWWSVSALRQLQARDATAQITLASNLAGEVDEWQPRFDLLASTADATDFVLEVENDGTAQLRFGDDQHGRRPNENTQFTATYRVANGVAGNVGANAIAHLLIDPPLAIQSLWNPLPAFGGIAAEDVEAARRDAPHAFRTQQRAVTAADYAAAAEQHVDVQRSAARFRWTGSWHTVFVAADRFDDAVVDAPFERALRGHLERFRMAGYDLEIEPPRHVPLDIALHVCVDEHFFRSDVLHAVREVLSSSLRADGSRGLFHPDNFSFGDTVYLSPIVAAVQAVTGVESVRVDRFRRLTGPDPTSLNAGFIAIGSDEVAQLDNNASFPDRGRLRITAGGGK